MRGVGPISPLLVLAGETVIRVSKDSAFGKGASVFLQV